jgi:hypothetical protein
MDAAFAEGAESGSGNTRAGETLGASVCEWKSVSSDFAATIGALARGGSVGRAFGAMRYAAGALWPSSKAGKPSSSYPSSSSSGSSSGSSSSSSSSSSASDRMDESAVAAATARGADNSGRPLIGFVAVRVCEAKKAVDSSSSSQARSQMREESLHSKNCECLSKQFSPFLALTQANKFGSEYQAILFSLSARSW